MHFVHSPHGSSEVFAIPWLEAIRHPNSPPWKLSPSQFTAGTDVCGVSVGIDFVPSVNVRPLTAQKRMTDFFHRAADLIAQADAIIIAAGAGMGVDSGLPDFRGNAGFWNAYHQGQCPGYRGAALSGRTPPPNGRRLEIGRPSLDHRPRHPVWRRYRGDERTARKRVCRS